MKKRRKSTGVALLLALALGAGHAVPGWAQNRSGGGLNDRFEAAAPAIGDRFPDVTAYNSQGEKVRLRDRVRDHYTVVVLGCLT